MYVQYTLCIDLVHSICLVEYNMESTDLNRIIYIYVSVAILTYLTMSCAPTISMHLILSCLVLAFVTAMSLRPLPSCGHAASVTIVDRAANMAAKSAAEFVYLEASTAGLVTSTCLKHNKDPSGALKAKMRRMRGHQSWQENDKDFHKVLCRGHEK